MEGKLARPTRDGPPGGKSPSVGRPLTVKDLPALGQTGIPSHSREKYFFSKYPPTRNFDPTTGYFSQPTGNFVSATGYFMSQPPGISSLPQGISCLSHREFRLCHRVFRVPVTGFFTSSHREFQALHWVFQDRFWRVIGVEELCFH